MEELLTKRRRWRIKLFFEGLIVGLVTGTIIAAFRFLLDQADIYRPMWLDRLSTQLDPLDWIITIVVIVSTARLISNAIERDKQIAGSGVPQIKGMLQGSMSMTRPLRLIAVKFLTATLAIGEGMSLGRAGLSVQFGACVGHFFNHNRSSVEGKFLLSAGAGAGLAAVFNAPLAGVIFCVEELNKRFSSELLLVSMTAAVSASVVVEVVFGIRPVFETLTPVFHTEPLISTSLTVEMLSAVAAAPLEFLVYLTVLGAFTGMLGAAFTRALLCSLDCYDRLKINGAKKFLIPLALAIGIGMFLPEVLGCGNVLVDELLSGGFILSTLMTLFVGKFLFTMICFGTGAPGGIFLPLLVLGALSGEFIALLASEAGLLGSQWSTLFIIFGMAGFFAAVVKAPITGSILIMELTGNFTHLLALIIVSSVAFLISDLFGGAPAYSALLNRSLHR